MASADYPKQKHIMILDDDSVQSSYLSEILNSCGFQVSVFEDAQTALLSLRGDVAFDLVITDLYMPGMNGMEFAEKLRKQCPLTPIIMLTGHANVETYLRAFALGITEYINKPVKVHELKRIVDSVIAKSKEQGNAGANNIGMKPNSMDIGE